MGVAVAVGGADGQLDRFAQQAEDDRVLARVVADAQGVIADLAVRTLARAAPAAVAMFGLAHHAGDDLAELQGRAAGRVFLEAMMPLDDLDVGPGRMVLERAGRHLSASFIARFTARLMLGAHKIGDLLGRLADAFPASPRPSRSWPAPAESAAAGRRPECRRWPAGPKSR